MEIYDCEKVSIIIPVYNCKRYLPKCIKSVVNQSYSNIEIILIDDGSIDGSSALCDEYAKRNSKIQVIHQKNAGPGAARNMGLDIMRGRYVTYVDADDYIAREYVETMLRLLQEYKADIAEVGLFYLYPLRNDCDASDKKITCFEGCDFLIRDYFSEKRQMRHYVGGRMYDMQKFGGIRFGETSMGEDTEYSLNMVMKCERLVKYNKCLYVYRAYQDSLTRNRMSHNRFDVVEIALREVILAEKSRVEIDSWDYTFQKFVNICYEILERLAWLKKEGEYPSELGNMVSVYNKMNIIAERHNVKLPGQLVEDIQHMDVWAKEYRRKNRCRLLIKTIRRCVSQTVAALKVRTLYEYNIDKR